MTQTPPRLERGQGRAEGAPADGVEDQVVLRGRRDLVADHHLVGAELAERGLLLGAAGGRGHVGAGEARELDGEVADAPGGAGDEHAAADE